MDAYKQARTHTRTSPKQYAPSTFFLDLQFWKSTRLGVSRIHAALCCISSGHSVFGKVLVYGFPKYMQHYAAFHLDLLFLEKSLFRGLPNTCSIMLHFLWTFCFWKSTRLGVSGIYAALSCISSRSSLFGKMKKVNKQCLLDTPRTVRVSEKTWQVIVRTRRP